MMLNRIVADRLELAFSLRVHVAAVPLLVTAFFAPALHLSVSTAYYSMIVVNTLGTYLANVVTDEREDAGNDRASWHLLTAHRSAFITVVIACFAVSFVLALQGGWQFVAFGFAINAFGALYGGGVPLSRDGRSRLRIKNIVVLKNVYSAFFWSAGLLIAPYLYFHAAPPTMVLYAIAASFCWAFYIELLWDVRDAAGDRLANVGTIPLRFGEAAARLGLHALNLAGCAALLAGRSAGLEVSLSLIGALTLFTAVFTELYMRMTERDWASHVYLIAVGVLLVAGIILRGVV